MICSKQEIYDLCKIKELSNIVHIINQISSYRMEIRNLEMILLYYESLSNDDEIIIDIKLQIKHFNRILKRIKEQLLEKIEKLVNENYDKEIIDKLYAAYNETLYIEYTNIDKKNNFYVTDYEEFQKINKVKIKNLREKAIKEMKEYYDYN